MIKKIATILILISILLFMVSTPVSASTTFRDIVAQSAILADADSGEVLFAHNINLVQPADALARIMTLHLAIYAIEAGHAYENEYVEMTESAWEGITSAHTTLNIRPGEIMPLIDLMHAAFVGEAAEACNMIAEHIAGSVDAFIVRMNARARYLGANNTNFVNTYGRFHGAQLTTAHDQFLILSAAAGNELFTEVAGTFTRTIPETNRSDARRLRSSNSLLNQNGIYFFRYNIAGMASVTFEGGHSYAGISEADGLTLVAIILGSDEVMRPDNSVDLRNLSEARRLFEWGYTQFGWHTVLSTSDIVASAPITHGAGRDTVNLRPESEIRLLINNDIPMDSFVRNITVFSVEEDDPLVAPIEAGEILGEITLVRDGVTHGPIPLVAATGVELHRFEFIRRQISDVLASDTARNILFGLGALILLYFILVIRYNVKRRSRMRRVAQQKQQLTEERRVAAETQYDERSAYYGQRQERRPTSPDAGNNSRAHNSRNVPSETMPFRLSSTQNFKSSGTGTYPGLGSRSRQGLPPNPNSRNNNNMRHRKD